MKSWQEVPSKKGKGRGFEGKCSLFITSHHHFDTLYQKGRNSFRLGDAVTVFTLRLALGLELRSGVCTPALLYPALVCMVCFFLTQEFCFTNGNKALRVGRGQIQCGLEHRHPK